MNAAADEKPLLAAEDVPVRYVECTDGGAVRERSAFVRALKRLNKARLNAGRRWKAKSAKRVAMDETAVSNGRVLVVEAFRGLGDSFYVHGLLRALVEHGKRVTLVTHPDTMRFYEASPYVESVHSIQDGAESFIGESYEAAIDLNNVALQYWKSRREIFARVRSARRLSCSVYTRGTALFNEYVPFAEQTHMSQRLGACLTAILKCAEPLRVAPFFPARVRTNPTIPRIYVNTVGSESDRCWSAEQVRAICRIFEADQRFDVWIYSPHAVPESRTVHRAATRSFEDAAQLVASSQAIISPDTSMVHLGSAFRIPVLAFYAGNEKDYFGYPIHRVFAPLSQGSQMIALTSGTASAGVIPLSAMVPDVLAGIVREFLLSTFSQNMQSRSEPV